MFKRINLLIVFFLYYLTINTSLSLEPDVFVQSTVNRASKILAEEITKEKKIEKLKTIALETVDIKGIGMYTLGPIRKSLSDNEKITYNSLFKEYFLKSFSDRLA